MIRAWKESRARCGPKKGRAQLVGEVCQVLAQTLGGFTGLATTDHA